MTIGLPLANLYPDYAFKRDDYRIVSGKYIVVYLIEKKEGHCLACFLRWARLLTSLEK
ncbi:MAG: hypothetical protein LBI43_07185 [Streptococcaceae bacterium]|nr:hypothetical protein [Streptococcaceae bacterium]